MPACWPCTTVKRLDAKSTATQSILMNCKILSALEKVKEYILTCPCPEYPALTERAEEQSRFAQERAETDGT